jgi:hypothetical protein
MVRVAMKVEYFVWEKDGRAVCWAFEEGDAQTIGDFPFEAASAARAGAPIESRLDAELALVLWSEDRAQALPFGWRRASSDEIFRIHAAMARRLGGMLACP